MESRSIRRRAPIAAAAVVLALAISSTRTTRQSATRDVQIPDGRPNLDASSGIGTPDEKP